MIEFRWLMKGEPGDITDGIRYYNNDSPHPSK